MVFGLRELKLILEVHKNDETTLFIRGGAAIKQPCAVCTGAWYERSTEPLKRLPVLGGRCACNYEQDTPAAALAGDKLGADYRLYDKSGGRIAPRGQYRRRVGSCADGGADGLARAPGICADKRRKRQPHCQHNHSRNEQWRIFNVLMDFRQTRTNIYGTHRRQPTYAHREQVHGLLYMAAYRLMLSKGVTA